MMNHAEAKKRIDRLSAEIEKYNYHYYILSESLVSDFEFDKMLEELQSLEAQFPDLRLPTSPTQRVGGTITKEFKTVQHKYPMMSLANTYSEQELRDFDERVRKLIGDKFEYVCELKFDGVAIGITYINGKFTYALTRGDGVQGDDVSNNVKTIRSIPLVLQKGDYPAEFEIRGEIIMDFEVFEKINAERVEIGEAPAANPRNFASGTLKMQDSSEVAKRQLDCYLYALYGDDFHFKTHFESLASASSWGFKTSPHSALCSDMDAVLKFITLWETRRHTLGFATDGVVIKVNEYAHQQELGFTAKSPRWAIAYKYKAQNASTKLLSISYQVGRTGAITPVANLQPVQLAGTTVKRASLHNADIIEKLGLHNHDYVFVEKGGEIIPKVTAVDLSRRAQDSLPVVYITHCPECGTALVRQEGEAAHYCPNDTGCPPQVKGRIEHFASRKAMNIDGLGSETIDVLVEKKLVGNIADIYDLTKENLLSLDRFAEKSATNLIDGIEASKKIPFERVLFAIGIRYVGDTVAKKLAMHFHNMHNLQHAEMEQLLATPEIGDKIAVSIKNYFANAKNMVVLQRLQAAGLRFQISESQLALRGTALRGLTIVATGTLQHFKRDEIKAVIEQNGAKAASAVSSKTSFVIAGADPGQSKIDKANELGIKIIGEDEFMQMLKSDA